MEERSWRQALESIESLGSKDQGVSSLADLHEARKRHLAQFFTPLSIVKVMWTIAETSFGNRAGVINILDSSIGTARMMHFASPDRFHIGGVDIHEDVVSAVMAAAEAHQLSAEVLCAGMQDIRPVGWDLALVNPPFSVNIQSPTLEPFPCVRHGRLGPGTAAQSDEYAIAQALSACAVVIAVVPQSLALDLQYRGHEIVGADASKRLRAILILDGKAFKDEGANVNTCIAVFGHNKGRYHGALKLSELVQLPDFDLEIRESPLRPRLRPVNYNTSEPVVSLAVTDNKEVRVVHSGRKIHLKFKCGGTQARVLNAVYGKRVRSTEIHRLPVGVRYSGQGSLDMQVLLATDDPLASLNDLFRIIKDAGGEPLVDPSLLNRLKRLVRQKQRMTQPFGHWIYRNEHADKVMATAKCRVPSDAKLMMAPAVKTGEAIELVRTETGWSFTIRGWSRRLTQEEADRLFDIPATSSGWVEAHPPLQRSFPTLAKQLEKEARALGIDKFLTWDFQFNDLIEVCIRPGSSVCAMKQGLGKSRLAAGLILLRKSKHGLVTMPACLLEEYVDRLVSAGLHESMWKVLRSPEDLVDLRRINIISNERLRMPIAADRVDEDDDDTAEEGPRAKRKRSRNTYAKKLRHRIGVLIADEGDFLANPDSDQSRAIAQVAAKNVFPLSGTPISSYPRGLLYVASAAVGDGVLGQPYGRRQPMLSAVSAKSMEFATRGAEDFADTFCTFTWTTNEFREDLVKGAKREVPLIRSLPAFRQWLAPFVKRRLQIEPEVQACVKIPVPTHVITTLPWEDSHLRYYIAVADEFAAWWVKTRETEQRNNLIAILARIGAVEQAASFPQRSRGSFVTDRPWGAKLTNHQRHIVEQAAAFAAEGKRVVIYGEWPELLELLAKAISDTTQATALCYHGSLSKLQRRANKAAFRAGQADVLCASFGITQAGLDLYEAEVAIFATRKWSARAEDQSVYRLLRPQQTKPVFVHIPHLKGSIHEYQAQMVQWKGSAAEAGLDWGTPIPPDVEFIHIDQILEKFIDGLAKMRGQTREQFRKSLKGATHEIA